MKVSEVIATLATIQAEHGDIEVCGWDSEMEFTSEITEVVARREWVSGDPTRDEAKYSGEVFAVIR